MNTTITARPMATTKPENVSRNQLDLPNVRTSDVSRARVRFELLLELGGAVPMSRPSVLHEHCALLAVVGCARWPPARSSGESCRTPRAAPIFPLRCAPEFRLSAFGIGDRASVVVGDDVVRLNRCWDRSKRWARIDVAERCLQRRLGRGARGNSDQSGFFAISLDPYLWIVRLQRDAHVTDAGHRFARPRADGARLLVEFGQIVVPHFHHERCDVAVENTLATRPPGTARNSTPG